MSTFAPIFPSGIVHSVQVPGGTIAVEDSGHQAGTKGLVLCLPGMGDVRQSYRFLAPALSSQGYRTLVADLRGHGDSSSGFSSYSQLDAAADVITILDTLHPTSSSPAVLVGNSMSAASIIQVAASQPSRVKGIIGLGPIPFDQSPDKIFRPVSYLLFSPPWGVSIWTSYWCTLFKGGKPDDFDSYSKALAAKLSETGRMAALGGLVRASKTPCWEVADKVTCPALMIIGSADPDYPSPSAAGEAIKAGLKSSPSVIVQMMDGVGHYPHVERPEETKKVVLDFIAGL